MMSWTVTSQWLRWLRFRVLRRLGIIPVWRVSQYGAVGDGVHDDAAAIQAAIDAAAAAGGHGCVLFDRPRFAISRPLILRAPHTVYDGAGATVSRTNPVSRWPLLEIVSSGQPAEMHAFTVLGWVGA